jgi:hypothetical protein
MFRGLHVRTIDLQRWRQIEAEDLGLYASLGSASYPRMSCLPSSHDSLPPDPSGEDADSRGILDLSSYIYDTAEEIGRISSAAVDNCDMARYGHECWSCRRQDFDKVEGDIIRIVACRVSQRAATRLAMIEMRIPFSSGVELSNVRGVGQSED